MLQEYKFRSIIDVYTICISCHVFDIYLLYMYCSSSAPIMQEDEMADFRDFLSEEMVKDRAVPR